MSVVRGLILAWLMSPEQFGLLGVALLIANVLMPIAGAGLHESIARYAPSHELRGRLGRFVRRSLAAAGLCAGLFVVALLLFSPALAPLLLSTGHETADAAASLGLMRAVALCVLTLVPYHATLALLRGTRLFSSHAVVEITGALAFTALAVVLVWLGWDSATHVIGAYAIGNLVGLLPVVVLLLRRDRGSRGGASSTVGQTAGALESNVCGHDGRGRPSHSRAPASSDAMLRPLFAYGVWAAGIASAWQLLSYYPTWHLLRVTDESTVGALHAVRMIAQLVQIAGAMLVSIVASHVTRAWEAEGKDAALRLLETLTKVSMIVLLLVGGGLGVGGPVVMRVLPESLRAGAPAYLPLLAFFLLFSITNLWAIRLSLIERPRVVCVAWSAGALVGVLVCFWKMGAPIDAARMDPIAALTASAWALTAGGATAAVLLLSMLAGSVTRPGWGSVLLMPLCGAVALGWWPALGTLILALGAAIGSSRLLSPAERSAVREILRKRTGP